MWTPLPGATLRSARQEGRTTWWNLVSARWRAATSCASCSRPAGAPRAAAAAPGHVSPGIVLMGVAGSVNSTVWGVGWSAEAGRSHQTGGAVGRAPSCSPEQEGGGRASPASDVYALGMIGYECLAG